jgi:ribosome-binding factor A
LIQEEVARILNRGLKDPRIAPFVTVTGVKVDPDLRQAIIYYSLVGDEAAHKSTKEGLEAARGHLRHELSMVLKMRHTPELMFRYDPSVENGDRIERLIREVHDKDSGSSGSSS